MDLRTYDGPSCTNVPVVRDPASKGLSFFPLSVPQRTHVTDRHLHNGPSCTTVLVVRDPLPEGLSLFLCPPMDTCDGQSSLRQSVLHNRFGC